MFEYKNWKWPMSQSDTCTYDKRTRYIAFTTRYAWMKMIFLQMSSLKNFKMASDKTVEHVGQQQQFLNNEIVKYCRRMHLLNGSQENLSRALALTPRYARMKMIFCSNGFTENFKMSFDKKSIMLTNNSKFWITNLLNNAGGYIF